jgi:hypothetical protein
MSGRVSTVRVVEPNEQDLIRRAAAWRIRSVERNRCVQATAVWELEGAAAECWECERARGRGETDPARAAWAGMGVDWALVTMAEGLIRVNARGVAISLGRCALDVRVSRRGGRAAGVPMAGAVRGADRVRRPGRGQR